MNPSQGTQAARWAKHLSFLLAPLAILGFASCGGDDTAAAAQPTTAVAPTTTAPPTTTVVPTTEAPTMTTEVTTTTEAKRTGKVQSCPKGQTYVDVDGDGWGGCTPPAVKPIGRDTAIALSKCIDANNREMGDYTVKSSTTDMLDEASDRCHEAITLLELDDADPLTQKVIDRAIKINLLILKVLDGGTATAADGVALDDDYSTWKNEVEALMDVALGR